MEDIIAKLLSADKHNRWEGTLRQASERWTIAIWQKVYGFPRGKEGMASQTNKFINDKFSNQVNRKDGYAVFECRDARTIRMLEFMVSILNLKRPT